MTRILLTGTTGFVGSNLVNYLRDYDIVSINRSQPYAYENIRTVFGDLTDYDTVSRVISDYEIEMVSHLAACAIVKKANTDPRYVLQNNINSTINILEACRKHDIGYFHQFSTDKIYGDNIIPTNETHTPNASGPYEMSKLVSELILDSFSKTYGIKGVVTRSANIYGPSDENKRIIPNTIKNCTRGNKPIIYKDNHTLREYIYIDDISSAVKHILDNKLEGTYNIGTGDVFDQESVVLEILKHFPHLQPIYEDKPNYKEIGNQKLDSSKIRKTGWEHKISFEEGIKRVIDAEMKLINR